MLVSLGFLIALWCNPEIKYPFVTSHLYVWEWLTIGLASVCLAIQPSKERLKGSFVSNLFINAFPAGVIQSIIVATMFVTSYINPSIFPHDSALAITILLLTIMKHNLALLKNMFLFTEWKETRPGSQPTRTDTQVTAKDR